MRRITVVSVLALALVVVAAVPAAALITPVRVFHLDGTQWYPAGNASYLVYTSNTTGRPGHWDAWGVDRATDVRERLNAKGTEGWSGNIEPGTNVAIYQQIDGAASTIHLYDLDSNDRTKAPGVNTTRWEWGPRISTGFISFVRNVRVNGRDVYRIYLYDRTSGNLRRLADYRIDRFDLTNGAVGDRYATWSYCDAETCRVVVYDAESRTRTTLDAPKDRPQYGPTIDEATGQVFFIRSGFGCGLTVGMWAAPLDGSSAPVKIASLPDGIDADVLGLALNPDTSATDLLFARAPCRRGGDVDIWSVPGVIGP